jgi:hypothetical protein
MDRLAQTAHECKAHAEAITAKFAYWERVIIHLKQSSITQRGIYNAILCTFAF